MALIPLPADTMFPHGTGRSSGFRDALQQTVTDREAVYFAYSHRLSFWRAVSLSVSIIQYWYQYINSLFLQDLVLFLGYIVYCIQYIFVLQSL